jgi:putative cell wall-binding protein
LSIRHRRVSKRLIAAAAAAATAATMLAIPTPASAVQVLDPTARLAGATRYGTAAAIATAVGCSNDIILASGENQPDALAAAALARSVNAPILLTPANSLSVEASNVIGNCAAGGAQTVHILGGVNAVSASVEAAVDALPGSVSVNRIAGANRYETAVAIANTVTGGAIGSFGGKRTAILASGTSYVDALAAGPISYRGVIGGINSGAHPILLTTAASLPASTDAALTSLGVQQVVIVGGTSVVSEAVQTAVEAKGITVARVSGPNRNATAAALATVATTPVGLGGFGFDGKNVGLANGSNAFGGFDALAAAPYLGKAGAPLVLTASLPTETETFLKSKATTITKLHIFGGLTAVDAATQTAAEKAATLVSPTATIVAGQGQESIQVVFSEAVRVDSVTVASFALNNVVGGFGPFTAVDPTGTTPVATTFVVGTPAPLAVNDVVRLVANTVRTLDGRFAATTSVTVAPDTTKPVATVLAAPNNASFQVKFSERVDPATVIAGNFTAVDGQSPANPLTIAGVSLDSTGTVVTVAVGPVGPPARLLLPGDRVGVNNNVVADLATPPNFAAGVTRTVLADNIAPTLTGVTYKTTDVAPASLVIDAAGNVGGAAVAATSVQYVSKAPGAAGNGYTVQYVAGAGATESITVSPAGLVVTTRAGGSTPSQIAAIVNASVASAAVTATAVLPASTSTIVAAGPAPLLGGSSNVTLTITYSEVVRGAAYGANSVAWVGGAFISPFINGASITTTPVDGTSNVYTVTITGANARPGAGAQFTANGFGVLGIQDLAGNALVPVNVTMTAAP